MIYSKITNSEINISKLGFGCMRLPTIEDKGKVRVDDEISVPLLHRAYELGINYFDTAWTYCGEDGERAVGHALKPFRDKVYISTKLPMWYVKKPEDFWFYLEAQMKRLDSSYIDFYHFHSVNKEFWKTINDLKLIEAAQKAKQQGMIRHICLSYHDKPELLEEIIRTQAFETVLCQYNLLNLINEEVMGFAKKSGMGVFVMGPLAGGNISLANSSFLEKFGNVEVESPTELGLKFVLGSPYVDCALSGMRSIEELEENVKLVETPLEAKQWQKIRQSAEKISKLLKVYCTDCQYCFVCPKNIRPAHVFRMYNNWKVWGLEQAAKQAYTVLNKDEWWFGNKPEECINCGACVKMCPQKLDIPALLEKVDSEFKELLSGD
jgi:predicted aldo/keto reductase-like oxidoreductase